MTAEKQLQQAKEIDFEIRCGLRELKYWKDLKQKMADAGITSANSHTALPKKIDSIVSGFEDTVNKDINRLIDINHQIMETIDKMDSTELQLALQMRYLCFYSWEKIAAEFNCCAGEVGRLHCRALKEYEKQMTKTDN